MANFNPQFSVTPARADYSGILQFGRGIANGMAGLAQRRREEKQEQERNQQVENLIAAQFGIPETEAKKYVSDFGAKGAVAAAQTKQQNAAMQFAQKYDTVEDLYSDVKGKDVNPMVTQMAATIIQKQQDEQMKRAETLLNMQNTQSQIKDRETDNARMQDNLDLDRQKMEQEAEQYAAEQAQAESQKRIEDIAYRVASDIPNATEIEGATPQEQIRGKIEGLKMRKELYPGEYKDEDVPLQGVARNIEDTGRLFKYDLSTPEGVAQAEEKYMELQQATSSSQREIEEIMFNLKNGKEELALMRWNKLFENTVGGFVETPDELKQILGILGAAPEATPGTSAPASSAAQTRQALQQMLRERTGR